MKIVPGIPIPDETECRKFFHRYGMLENIIRHSLCVRDVAKAICTALNNETTVNCPLVCAAALLHDITKTQSLITGDNHAESGARLVAELGYPELSEVIVQHGTLNNFDPASSLTEAEIVFYADKRVLHDTIVTIDERIKDLLVRYGKSKASYLHIVKIGELLKDLELKIKNSLDGALEEIIRP
ncbi:MAG: HDIG domain-containing protein [Spirochaetes bacterium]|jgi:uncharacterized protein|nr:HDIG domain-containing protein [Spirochaetota bacterium]